ncbi:AAA family ATPase [Eubacterium oxidoreducens]|uniref:cytidylate kinase-like family protein n=1 Tax=Eubacterium oxidoreducens TaxID=1732 RepID=UPI000B7D6217|nr:cytidylate kinase-like family protein [Eubacterium oxidoreducens]
MENYVITIARGFGSGGKEIGMMLSEMLNIPCYERQILTMASDFSGIEESVFVETDEKLRGKYIANALRKMPLSNVLEPWEKGFMSDINVFNVQAEIIRSLARTQSCIIVGKCADDILKDYQNVVSVYIEAPRRFCVNNIRSKLHVSVERANQMISSTDRNRAKYYSYYTGGKEWTNPVNYDLVLNTERVGKQRCAQMIAQYVKLKFA